MEAKHPGGMPMRAAPVSKHTLLYALSLTTLALILFESLPGF